MTAHTPPLPHPAHEGIPSIVALHVDGADCACPACRANGVAVALALDRLATFLDGEGDDLDRVLRLLDLRGGREDLAAFETLHVEPGAERAALEVAVQRLERVLEDLAEVPSGARTVGLPAAADRHLVMHLDGAIRWLGARTQDVLSALRHALAT